MRDILFVLIPTLFFAALACVLNHRGEVRVASLNLCLVLVLKFRPQTTINYNNFTPIALEPPSLSHLKGKKNDTHQIIDVDKRSPSAPPSPPNAPTAA